MTRRVSDRRGYILADALAGLAVLAVGLGSCLACQAQARALTVKSEALRQWRQSAPFQIEIAAIEAATAVPDPLLASAGVALCFLEARPSDADPQWLPEVATYRFCRPREPVIDAL